MSDLIYQIYPSALDCEISIDQFWNLTIAEITDLMECYHRKQRMQLKQELSSKHFLAQDIAQYVAQVLYGSNEVTIVELWDRYPDLFAEEGAVIEKERQEKQAAVYKAQMMDFAYRHNHARNRGDA